MSCYVRVSRTYIDTSRNDGKAPDDHWFDGSGGNF
jgi:hypothetical protein